MITVQICAYLSPYLGLIYDDQFQSLPVTVNPALSGDLLVVVLVTWKDSVVMVCVLDCIAALFRTCSSAGRPWRFWPLGPEDRLGVGVATWEERIDYDPCISLHSKFFPHYRGVPIKTNTLYLLALWVPTVSTLCNF